jgi:hypothetical protein
MTLVLWEASESLFPSEPEERGKLIMPLAEDMKKDVGY